MTLMAESSPDNALVLTQPNSDGQLKFDKLWKNAIEAYRSSTGHDILNDPLRRKLEACTSIAGVVSILKTSGKNFETFRKSGHIFWSAMASISQMLSIVIETSGEVAAAGSVPGGKVVFVAVGRLLQATRGVSEAYGATEKAFGKLEYIFKRLETHLRSPIPITPQLRDIYEKMLIEVLKFTGLLIRYIKNTTGQARASRVKKVMFHSKRRVGDLGSTLLGMSDAKEVLENLDNLTTEEHLRIATEMHVAVHVMSENIQRVRSDVADVAGTLSAGQADTAVRMRAFVNNLIDSDARKWLSPPNPTVNHDRVRKTKQSGTCNWIFGKKFQQWRGRPDGVYWLHGNPGSGKSVLCSSVIDKLISENETVVYFYFDFNDSCKQTTAGLLTSLVYQLAACSTSCYDLLQEFYARNRSSLNPREEMLTDCLVEMLRSCERIFIILDALDEYPVATRDVDLLPLLDSLIERSTGGLRLFMTSRLENDIKTSFKDRFITMSDIHYRKKHTNDLERYIKQTLTHAAYCNWPENIKNLATSVLLSKAQGMFLWEHLQLRDLRGCSPIDVEHALDDLPVSLNTTYERVLRTFCSKKKIAERIRRIFECIAFGEGDFSADGLAEVFAIDFTGLDGAILKPQLRPRNPTSALLDSCSGLIHIVSVSDRFGTWQKVQFVHYTVQEYLLSNSLPDDLSSFALSAESGHATLAQMCLATLTSSYPQCPLEFYAVLQLGVHVAHCPDNADVEKLLSKFLHPNNPYYPSRSSPHPFPSGSQPLYWAASQNLTKQTEFLLELASTDINAIGGHWGTALCAAAHNGHLKAVELLINRGAGVETGGDYGPPLCCAAIRGYKEVIAFLLDHGACIHTHGNGGRTALHVAVQSGLQVDNAILLLLERGSDVNAADEDRRTPLHLASGESVVQLILEHGAAVNVRNNRSETPLHAAYRNRSAQSNIVSLLLEYGAIIDSLDEHGNAPLHIAAADGKDDVLSVLLEHGAQINVLNHRGQSPFCLAIKNARPRTARMLIERGAHPEISLAAGWTILHVAVSSRNIYTISDLDELLSLLEMNLDSEARTDYGQSALSIATATTCAQGSLNIIRYLIDRGANVNATDSNGFRAIDYAAARGHADTVRLLIECGADTWTESGPHHGTFMDIARRTHRVMVGDPRLREPRFYDDWPKCWPVRHASRNPGAVWEDNTLVWYTPKDLSALVAQGRPTVPRGERMMRRVRRSWSMSCLSGSEGPSADTLTIDDLKRENSRTASVMRHLSFEMR